jgi:hypothetical protein
MIRVIVLAMILMAISAPAHTGFKMFGPNGYMENHETEVEREAREAREAAALKIFREQQKRPTQAQRREPEDNFDLSGVEWRRTRGLYSGRGAEEMTKKFGYRAGTYRLEYVYKARGHFAIWMYTRRGMSELLVNRIGKADTHTTVVLPKDDEVWFEIHSSTGNWEFTFERIR